MIKAVAHNKKAPGLEGSITFWNELDPCLDAPS
jgi:hypothetical protein